MKTSHRSLLQYAVAFILASLLFSENIIAQNKATWIWYPGDFEIWLGNKMQNRRTERTTFFPPFWKLDNHFVLMDFHKDFDLKQPEEVNVSVEGKYNLKIDGKAFEGMPKKITVPAGKHRISIKVFNQASVPAVYLQGKTIYTDSSWLVTYEDKEWIDETGKTSDQSGTTWLKAGYWNFDNAATPPSQFSLPVKPVAPVSIAKTSGGFIADFGKESFGYIKLHGITGKGKVSVYYGESKEEAMATETCETLDRFDIEPSSEKEIKAPLTKAFRFVNVAFEPGVGVDSVSMLYEYADVKEKGSFHCSDEEINNIYDVSKYTFQLNTREFFIDGIKRDRWIWSGDAYQSYLMNYYLYFDEPTVSRTLLALRGKDPVTSHINTIMDYTFYWFLGIYDYYQFTGDKTFIHQFYPRMQSMMEYCLGRRNKDGLMEGLSGDWVFIDWADGLSKKGAVSFEQMLFARSLETMAICADIENDKPNAKKYKELASDVKQKLFDYYWNDSKQALVHSRVNGNQTSNVTRYANMFGIFFDYFNANQKLAVKEHVLLNDSIQKITTPYMRFYELEALCAMGEQTYVTQQMKDYWGGMLKLGATSFWEEYNPSKKGAEHYAMYGRPFGKSLCHAWGASPIYLLGRYYLGVSPTAPGYATYTVKPSLGGLKWIEGDVPTPKGKVHVYASEKEIKIKADEGNGTLQFTSKSKPSCKQTSVRTTGKNSYEISLEKGKEYVVSYKAI